MLYKYFIIKSTPHSMFFFTVIIDINTRILCKQDKYELSVSYGCMLP